MTGATIFGISHFRPCRSPVSAAENAVAARGEQSLCVNEPYRFVLPIFLHDLLIRAGLAEIRPRRAAVGAEANHAAGFMPDGQERLSSDLPINCAKVEVIGFPGNPRAPESSVRAHAP